MKGKKVLIGLLVVFVITASLVLAGCLGTDDGFSGDTALNGTWVRWSGNSILKFDNGNWEYSEYGPYSKGTYTTNNGWVTQKITHVYSGNDEVRDYFLEMGLQANRWYSMTELKSNFGSYFTYMAYEFGMNPVTFEEAPIQYFVSGNTLYFGEAVYTRQ